MAKIRVHYLVGDVHRGGHDVHRVAAAFRTLLDESGAFDLTVVCDTETTPFSPRPRPGEFSRLPSSQRHRRGLRW